MAAHAFGGAAAVAVPEFTHYQTIESAGKTVLCFSLGGANNRYLYVGDNTGEVREYDVEFFSLQRVLRAHLRSILALACTTSDYCVDDDADDDVADVPADESVGMNGHTAAGAGSGGAMKRKRTFSTDDDGAVAAAAAAAAGAAGAATAPSSARASRRRRACGLLVTTSNDATLKVWRLADMQLMRVVQLAHGCALAMLCVGDLLVFGGQDTHLKVLNLGELMNARFSECNAPERGVALHKVDSVDALTGVSAAAATAAVATTTSTAGAAASSSSSSSSTLPYLCLSSHTGYIHSLTVNTQRGHIFSGSGDATIRVWNLHTFACEHTLEAHDSTILALDSDRSFLYSGSQDMTIKVWDLTTYYVRHTLVGHVDDVLALHVNADGTAICSADAAQNIIIWSTAAMQPVFRGSEPAPITTFTMTGSLLLGGMANGSVKAWHLECIGGGGGGIGGVGGGAASTTTPSAIVATGTAKRRRHAASSAVVQPQQQHVPRALSSSAAAGCGGGGGKYAHIVQVLGDFVSFKSVSGDCTLSAECWNCAKYLKTMLSESGFEVLLVEGAAGCNPLVFARLGEPDPRKKTVALFGHYDVVPCKMEAQWNTPPFHMTGLNGYLYGRGTTDNKGPIVAFVFAVQEMLAELAHSSDGDSDGDGDGSGGGGGGGLPVNVVLLIEGEEENGSGGFGGALQANRAWLGNIDTVIISNNYWIDEQRPCVTYGLRGVVDVTLRVDGAARPVHSGVDGGVFREPLADMVQLLARLRDAATGRVLVPGFYDCGLTTAAGDGGGGDEAARLDDVQFDVAAYRHKLGVRALLGGDSARDVLSRRWCEPSLTVHFIDTGVQNPTLIPNRAEARISVRFVPGQDPAAIAASMAAHLSAAYDEELCSCNTLSQTVTRTVAAWQGDVGSASYRAAEQAIEHVWGVAPVYIREGGSIPNVSLLCDVLGAEAVILPLGQSSDNAHLPNERIRLRNLVNGKDVFKRFFVALGAIAAAEVAAEKTQE